MIKTDFHLDQQDMIVKECPVALDLWNLKMDSSPWYKRPQLF